VIDEIDAFESYAKDFLTLVKSILSSQSNTILIGIANSVDLPFKHKASAIAMRNQQLLFKPYDEQQIIEVMEKKTFSKFRKQPDEIRRIKEINSFAFNFIDEKAQNLIASKVAKMNGDIRVAFDIIKSCFSELHESLMLLEEE
jgi:Cdc6-like AAA superfamily ATPase